MADKQITTSGYSYRRPDGSLSTGRWDTVQKAQEQAAFNIKRAIWLPHDWNTAYERGYRVVHVVTVVTESKDEWKEYHEHGNY